ncbi:hypothetical protein [Paraburkholderia sp. BL10I2N1]
MFALHRGVGSREEIRDGSKPSRIEGDLTDAVANVVAALGEAIA